MSIANISIYLALEREREREREREIDGEALEKVTKRDPGKLIEIYSVWICTCTTDTYGMRICIMYNKHERSTINGKRMDKVHLTGDQREGCMSNEFPWALDSVKASISGHPLGFWPDHPHTHTHTHTPKKDT